MEEAQLLNYKNYCHRMMTNPFPYLLSEIKDGLLGELYQKSVYGAVTPEQYSQLRKYIEEFE